MGWRIRYLKSLNKKLTLPNSSASVYACACCRTKTRKLYNHNSLIMIDNFIVSDRKSFIEFLELLTLELKNSPDKWENKTLEDFLDAMTRYSDDIQAYYDNVRPNEKINADTASWQTFA